MKRINPATGIEEDDGLPEPVGTPLPAELANLKPPAVVYPPALQAPAVVPEPMPAAPVPVPMPAPRMAQVETGSTTTTTTSQKVQTPEEIKLRAEADKLVESQIANEQKAAGIATKQAEIEQLKAQELDTRAAAKEQAVLKLLQDGDTEVEKRTAELNLQSENFKKMEFKDYWADKGTGNKILAAISIGLGSLGAGMAGRQGNTALDIINKAVDDDFARQKAAMQKAETQVNIAKENVKDAQNSRKQSFLDLEMKSAVATEAVASKYASMLAAQGVPAAQIQSNTTVLALQQRALEKKAQVQEALRKDVQTQVQKKVETLQVDGQGRPIKEEKPLTETQGNAVTFGKRMTAGIRNYDKAGGLSTEGAEKIRRWVERNQVIDKSTGLMVIGAGGFVAPDLSERDRLAAQAMQEVITAGLRKDSGAAIGVSEFQNEFNSFAPRAGDSPVVVRQKRGTMTTRLAALSEQAGTGRTRLDIPAEPTQAPGGDVKVVNGRKFRKVPGGWEETQ